MDPSLLGNIAVGVASTTAFHPLAYAKTLIQLGHEPLSPVQGTTLLGRTVWTYPNIIKYVRHIRKVDGFTGMYRGLGPRIAGGVIGNLVTNAVCVRLSGMPLLRVTGNTPPPEEIEGQTDDTMANLQRMLRDTSFEMTSRCAGIIVSQPFHVIMVRSMAQFVGRETIYNSTYGGVVEIYNNEGILGFFKGLAPRLLGEILTVWLANILGHIINNFILPSAKISADYKTYTNTAGCYMVSTVTYPFMLVSNMMTVNGSGLEVGRPPCTPIHASWADCWRYLRQMNALKRGSSLFWRYYAGPMTFRNTGYSTDMQPAYN